MLVIFQTNASAMASVIIQLADLCLCSALVIWRTSVFVTFTNKRVSVLWQLENEDQFENSHKKFFSVYQPPAIIQGACVSPQTGRHGMPTTIHTRSQCTLQQHASSYWGVYMCQQSIIIIRVFCPYSRQTTIQFEEFVNNLAKLNRWQ